MAFECNIDARGKAYRMKLGFRLLTLSIILSLFTFLELIPFTLGWFLAGCSFVGSGFTIWESRMGWCIIRAMGFRTRI